MYNDRIPQYEALEKAHSSKIIALVTGDRPGWETQVAHDAIDLLADHLDTIGVQKKISLFLYTPGGQTLAGWAIDNLIRMYCDEFEVIVPRKALSTGTLICLGADRIVMTKQATLGPIDPSVNNPLNPQIPGAAPLAKAPVSVEEVKGYIELAKEELGTDDESVLLPVFLKLSEQVHPLVLGQIFRSRAQIKELARRLVSRQLKDEEKIEKVISFLCSESGSHDYTINRREARGDLGLAVEIPTDETYEIIKDIYDDVRQELELHKAHDPAALLAGRTQHAYSVRRCIIESPAGGSHGFFSRGTLIKQQVPGQQGPVDTIHDNRTFEGWEKIA